MSIIVCSMWVIYICLSHSSYSFRTKKISNRQIDSHGFLDQFYLAAGWKDLNPRHSFDLWLTCSTSTVAFHYSLSIYTPNPLSLIFHFFCDLRPLTFRKFGHSAVPALRLCAIHTALHASCQLAVELISGLPLWLAEPIRLWKLGWLDWHTPSNQASKHLWPYTGVWLLWTSQRKSVQDLKNNPNIQHLSEEKSVHFLKCNRNICTLAVYLKNCEIKEGQ